MVRHPQEGIQPLDLIGAQADSNNYLGSLDKLITNAPPALPVIQTGLEATDVNDQKSGQLKLAIGATVPDGQLQYIVTPDLLVSS